MKKYILIILTIFVAMPLFAAESTLKGRVSFSYTDAQGNTDEDDFKLSFDFVEQKNEKLKFGYKGSYLYSKDDNIKSADKKTLGFTSEFIKSKLDSCYLTLGYMKDEFSGYEQQITVGAGYSRYFIKEKDTEFKWSIGIDFTNEKYTDNTNFDEKWLKTGFDYKRNVAENIKVFASTHYYAPSEHTSDNYRADGTVGFVFYINPKFDMEMKYTVEYRQTPATAENKRTDRTFYTGLVYKI